MDKKVYIIAFLGILAFVLVMIHRSHRSGNDQGFSLSRTSQQPVSDARIRMMADSTLQLLGVTKRNIRPVRNSKDVKVLYPETFDVIDFILAMQDSLKNFNATIHSVENVKNNTSVTQIKTGDSIVTSYIFRQEPASLRKGARTSLKNRTKQH